MKEKILAAIKAKFPAINLSKKRLDAIAAKIEAKVIDDETKIDAALTLFDEYNPLAEMAKLDDALRNYQAKEKEAGKDKNKPDQPAETPAEKATREAAEAKAAADAADADKDTPPYVKKMMEQFATITNELAAIKGEKQQTTIRTKITDQLKDVPVIFWGKRQLPDKEDAMEAFVTDVNADYAAYTKELTDKGLAAPGKPKGGTGAAGGNGKASQAEVDAVVKDLI